MGSAFSPGDSQLYFAGTDRSIRRLDVSTGQETAAWTGGAVGRCPLAVSRDGRRLAVALHENTTPIEVQVRTAADGGVIGQFTTTHKLIADLSLDRRGERVATCSPDGTIVIWQAASGRKLLTLRGHTAEIDLVTFSPDGQTLVSGGRDQTVRVWDVGP
jgi:WD40 repeat protein